MTAVAEELEYFSAKRDLKKLLELCLSGNSIIGAALSSALTFAGRGGFAFFCDDSKVLVNREYRCDREVCQIFYQFFRLKLKRNSL